MKPYSEMRLHLLKVIFRGADMAVCAEKERG